MTNTAVVVILFAAVFESLLIILSNIFTIFVFWKHRNRLKRTCFLLINLAVADLLVGFTEPIALGNFYIPRHLEDQSIIATGNGNITPLLQVVFSFASLFFLVLIALERAYALIWPLHHRMASTRGYIYSATLTWVAGISVGILTLLAVYDILGYVHWTIAFVCIMVLCLITVCLSYLAIRYRLNQRVPAIEAAHNRQDGPQQNAKFSRTLFVVITASLHFWLPSIIFNGIYFLCSGCVPVLLFHIFNMLRLANSLVNPVIYSFRIPMFRETLKRMNLCKQSKQYTVNYTA